MAVFRVRFGLLIIRIKTKSFYKECMKAGSRSPHEVPFLGLS
jgi:hypothetical protein